LRLLQVGVDRIEDKTAFGRRTVSPLQISGAFARLHVAYNVRVTGKIAYVYWVVQKVSFSCRI